MTTNHTKGGKVCECGKYHYDCFDCGRDCTMGTDLGPPTSRPTAQNDYITRCRKCEHKYEQKLARIHGASDRMLEVLKNVAGLVDNKVNGNDDDDPREREIALNQINNVIWEAEGKR